MSSTAQYYDKRGQIQKGEPLKINKRHLICVSMARRLLAPNWRVLDLCCGVGFSTYQLKRLVEGLDIIGVDISGRRIADAKRLWPESRFVQCRAEIFLKQLNEQVDAICCFDGLEHFEPEDHGRLTYLMCRSAEKRVLLNIPNRDFLNWCRVNRPELVQEVDAPPSTLFLIESFERHGFDLEYMQEYAVEAPRQYRFFSFKRKPKSVI